MTYKGFIANSKQFLNYDNLPPSRKLRFWLRLPCAYIKVAKNMIGCKLFVEWKVQEKFK